MSDGLSNTLPQASRPDTSHSMIGYGKHIVPPNLALHTQREHRAPWFLDTNLNMRMAVPNTDAPPGILAPPVDIQQSHKLQNLGGRKNAKFDSSLAKPKGNELVEHVQSTPSSTGSSVTPVSIQDEQRTSDQLRTPHFSARFERDESNCVSPPRRRIIFSLGIYH
jgi:hypothetical protein